MSALECERSTFRLKPHLRDRAAWCVLGACLAPVQERALYPELHCMPDTWAPFWLVLSLSITDPLRPRSECMDTSDKTLWEAGISFFRVKAPSHCRSRWEQLSRPAQRWGTEEVRRARGNNQKCWLTGHKTRLTEVWVRVQWEFSGTTETYLSDCSLSCTSPFHCHPSWFMWTKTTCEDQIPFVLKLPKGTSNELTRRSENFSWERCSYFKRYYERIRLKWR